MFCELSTKVGFLEFDSLDHRSHRSIEDYDAIAKQFFNIHAYDYFMGRNHKKHMRRFLCFLWFLSRSDRFLDETVESCDANRDIAINGEWDLTVDLCR